LFGQPIDYFALAFVAPLASNNYYRFAHTLNPI
jgi:hypothetical protein